MSPLRLVLEGARWSVGFWLLWSVPRCRGGDDGQARPEAAVVVPARDEEGNLGPLLASLAVQGPPTRTVVVDDHSSDATAALATAAGATVVPAPALPGGWTGKCWACATGADAAMAAGASTLVFLDADCVIEPGGLARLLAEHRARGGLVSVQPYHVTVRPYEGLSAFFNVVAMMGVGAFTPSRRQPAAAFGPCLVTSAADYRAVGGHASVRGEVAEDIAVARVYRAAGLPVACLGGQGAVRFRMYPGGLGQLVEGWSKNMASGAAATRPLTLVLVVAWVSGCISAPWYLATDPAGGGLLVYAAYAAQLGWMLRRVGRFGPWPAALFPVPLAAFLAVFARSLVLTAGVGTVRWKGRAVAVGRRAR